MKQRFQIDDFLPLTVGIPLTVFVIITTPVFDAMGLPLTRIGRGMVGLLLQTIPFALIGVLVSAAVETFLTPRFLQRHWPRTLSTSMALSLGAGCCMPVCDCVAVPTFASLLRKGLPLPAAVTFLCAAPVMNPVAIWSTAFAFADRPSMIVARLFCGAIVAIIVGLSFRFLPPSDNPLRTSTTGRTASINPHHPELCAMHNSVQHITRSASTPDAPTLNRETLVRYLAHTHTDFMSVMPLILIGTTTASAIRTMMDTSNVWSVHSTLTATIVMMAVAFASSLCSTSDAVIARSLSNALPLPSILAYLVFCPMLDVKNVLMLIQGCRPRFVWRLSLTIAAAAFVVTSLTSPVLETFA